MTETFFYSCVEKNPMQAALMISKQVSGMENVIGLHYGSSVFQPPSFLFEKESAVFCEKNLVHSMKSYEEPRGSLLLRKEIAKWYAKRLKLSLNPEKEILITNGSSEALTLSILATTSPADTLLILNPSYTSFETCSFALDRKVKKIKLLKDIESELGSLSKNKEPSIKTCVVNSPCNPTGMMFSKAKWHSLKEFCEKNNAYLVHDEILDVFSFGEDYISAASVELLTQKTILINSMSKTFALPGLRVGWMIAEESLVSKVAELKSSLCLGVNIMSEKIAEKTLSNPATPGWIKENKLEIVKRMKHARSCLTEKIGFSWPYTPVAGFCLFPDVSRLYDRMPHRYRVEYLTKGAAVAQYLLDEKGVAVTPGSIYGSEGNNNVKIVVCGKENEFYSAIARICQN